ncbi:MAG: sugar transferase, partial [Chloroflexota bacterium]
MERASNPVPVGLGRAVPRPAPGRRQQLQHHLRLFFRVADLLAINVAFIAAYYLRYVAGVGGDVAGENYVDFDAYLPLLGGLTLTLFTTYHLAGVYRNPARESLLMEAWNLVLSTSFGITLIFAGVFLLRSFAYSRGLFLIAWVLIIALVVASRILARVGLAVLRRRGVGVERVLVVGGDPLAMTVMHVLATEPGLGYRLAGFIQDGGGDDLGRFRCLGSLGDLADLLGEGTIDEVIIALPSTAHQSVPDITEVCAAAGVSYKIVPDLYEMSLSLSKVDVEDLRGIPLVGMKPISIQGSDLLVKRAMDVAAGLLGLALISPLWLALVLAIKIGSPGPVYFVQTRLGRD